MLKEAALIPENADIPQEIGDVGGPEDERRPIWIPGPHLALGIALLITIPSIVSFVEGNMGVTGILVRYLVALLISWVGLVLVGNVINAYLPVPPPEQIPHALTEGDDLANLSGYDMEPGGEEAVAPPGPDSGVMPTEPEFDQTADGT